MRTLKKAYSKRGLAIMAGKFVQETVNKIEKDMKTKFKVWIFLDN